MGLLVLSFLTEVDGFPEETRSEEKTNQRALFLYDFYWSKGNVEKWGQAVERLLFQAAVNS